MRILIIDNNFSGAYGSFGTFLSEISNALSSMGHNVVVSHSVVESVGAIVAGTVDFSIGIGKYGQFLDGAPLYDVYSVHHYQWVVDCPYKFYLDTESTNITYIFIDRDFGLVNWHLRNRPLYLPLGIPSDSRCNRSGIGRRRGVVFAGQVRDSTAIIFANRSDKTRGKIRQIVDFCLENLSRPFLANFSEVTACMNDDERRSFFRPVNSFVRAYKRELVISSIKSCPICVVGDVTSHVIMAQKNVHCAGRLPYIDAFGIIGVYGYALNIEPNFNSGRHDRVIRAPFHSALPITNVQHFPVDGLSEKMVEYDYDSVEDAVETFVKITEEELTWRLDQLCLEIDRQYAWPVLLQRIIENSQGAGI